MATLSAKRFNAAWRRERSTELRRDFYTFRQIAKIISDEQGKSVSHTTIQKDIKMVLGELVEASRDQLDEWREMHLLQLDELARPWIPLTQPEYQIDPNTGQKIEVRGPVGHATDRVLRILQQKAQIQGIAQPKVDDGNAGGNTIIQLISTPPPARDENVTAETVIGEYTEVQQQAQQQLPEQVNGTTEHG